MGLRPLMLALLLGAVAATAPAATPVWDHVTVTTIEGGTYRDVRLAWKLEGFLLRLRAADRTETNLNPRIVANIVAADGRDITQEVADASPSNAGFAVLGDLKTEPFDLDWSLDAGGSLGLTGGYGGFSRSEAWYAGLRRGLGSRVHLRAEYRSQHAREHVPDHGATLGTWTDEAALLLGYRPIHPRRNRNLTYLELGPTLVHWPQRYEAETGLLTGGPLTRVGLVLRGGVLFPVSAHLGIEVGGVLSARPPLAEGQGKAGWVVGLNVGLAAF